MKYVVCLASIVLGVFYTVSLMMNPLLGLPGQLNYSPVTVEEIHALEWIGENYDDFTWDDVICDYFCREYAALVFFDLEIHLAHDWNEAVVSDSEFWDEQQIIYNMTVLGEEVSTNAFRFSLYSPRQAEKGIVRLWSTDGTRRYYEANPMMDAWEGNPEWVKVYEEEGVIVYEWK